MTELSNSRCCYIRTPNVCQLGRKSQMERRGKDMERLRQLFKDEEGATMVEYALMLALIAVVCILAVTLIGTSARDKFNQVGTEIQNANP